MYIAIINVLMFIISIVIVSIILLLSLLLLLLLSPLVLLSYSLKTHGGYIKSDIYLPQFLCHLTFDIKLLYTSF